MSDPLTSLIAAVGGTAVLIFFFWPKSGLVSRWRRAAGMTARVLGEDALKFICKREAKGKPASVQSVAGNLSVSVNHAVEVLRRLAERGLVLFDGDDLRLTMDGRKYALGIIRAHRLWERHLADNTGYRAEEWHEQAETWEHRLTPSEVEDLDRRLGSPTHDPHGDPIPTSTKDLVFHGGRPLTAAPPNRPVRIVHLEDEPDAVYAQLVAEGLRPGMIGRLLESTPDRVTFWSEGEEHLLAPVVAANIAVLPVTEEEPEPAAGERLSSLAPGESAEVVRLSRTIRGPERRRLMDLGLLPGTPIHMEMESPTGDLTAYRIRGALIALRASQTDLIQVRRGGATEKKEAAS